MQRHRLGHGGRYGVATTRATLLLAAALVTPNVASAARPTPTMATTSLPAATPGQTVIGAGDLIDIQVYDVQQLSFQGIRIDPAGHFSYPLLGTIDAQGKAPQVLSAEMAEGLRRYLVNPQVTVFVKESATNTVTVVGSVTEPGKFKLIGHTSLMDAVALAKGFTRIADQKQVTILRTIGGQQTAALFDMRKIRRGEMTDPPLLGGDKVVVGINHLEAAWRDALLAAPLLGIFAQLNN